MRIVELDLALAVDHAEVVEPLEICGIGVSSEVVSEGPSVLWVEQISIFRNVRADLALWLFHDRALRPPKRKRVLPVTAHPNALSADLFQPPDANVVVLSGRDCVLASALGVASDFDCARKKPRKVGIPVSAFGPSIWSKNVSTYSCLVLATDIAGKD